MAERCPRCSGQDVRRQWLVDGTWTDVRNEHATLERVACRSIMCGAVSHVTVEASRDLERRLASIERVDGVRGAKLATVGRALVPALPRRGPANVNLKRPPHPGSFKGRPLHQRGNR